jgi:hypothetical protein
MRWAALEVGYLLLIVAIPSRCFSLEIGLRLFELFFILL